MSQIPIFPFNPNIDISKAVVVENQFTDTEITEIFSLLEKLNYEEATILSKENGSNLNLDVRKSKVKWLYQNQDTTWLYKKIMQIIHSVNLNKWNFELVMAREPIQYTEYDLEGEYDWHIDTGMGLSAQRKVSMSLLLSDPDEYEGGNLEIWPGGEVKVMPRIKNSIVIFPSCLMHRVTPVTKGVRKSLVLWVGGTPYR